jgi:class 3 adenylate cyclase
MLTAGFKKWVGAETGTIALVFTDVVGSTTLTVQLGDASMDDIRTKHFDISAVPLKVE